MVRKGLQDIFKFQVPGYPRFKPATIMRNSLSDPAVHNRMIDLIAGDIEDLYDTNTAYNNELLSMFGLYTTEHEHNAARINDITNRIYMLLQNKLYNNVSYTVHDNFNDFLKIDFTGDPEWGVIQTNSHICLKGHCVMNGITTKDSKISLSEAEYRLDVPESVIYNETVSDVRNALKDTLNEAWIQRVTTGDANGLVIRLTIEMPDEADVTDIEFDIYTTRPVLISLFVFDKNKAQHTYRAIETDRMARWNFKKRKIKAFTFEITKQEADGMNDALEYEYYIGAKNISVYKNIYQEKSTLTSMPYEIINPFNYANLDVRQVIPPDTYINYYIGVGWPYKDIQWQRCRSGQTIDLGLLSKISRHINNQSYGYGTKADASSLPDGTPSQRLIRDAISAGPYYNLGYLEQDNIIESMIELYVGDNMWERRKLVFNEYYDGVLRDVYNSYDIDYIGLDRIQAGNITFADNTIHNILIDNNAQIEWQQPNTAYCYTTHVYCNESSSIRAIIGEQGNFEFIRLYVNGYEAELEPNYTPIRLAAGWNQIQIITVTGSNPARLICNAFFYEAAETVRAVKDRIRYVTPYQMVTNIHGTAHKCFMVVNKRIVVNYDPRPLNMTAYIKYLYMHDPEIFKGIQIRLMAILESRSSDITPVLKEYNIILI